jgi:hypothetical protein
MEPTWTDAPLLYFHFNSANGGFASLPMKRTLITFEHEFNGIPGTVKVKAVGSSREKWVVPGFQCLSCAKVYFAPERDGLKHECMNNGGIISTSPSMGAYAD